jgi:hypothetical protein
MTRRGGAGRGSGSNYKGCRGAGHGQACTKDRTGAVAVRAALESAVQVGRGDEDNRQAEMANPTKYRDWLQLWPWLKPRSRVGHPMSRQTAGKALKIYVKILLFLSFLSSLLKMAVHGHPEARCPEGQGGGFWGTQSDPQRDARQGQGHCR